ncbi:MAG: protein kinase, partial [Polyangiales bacterium]
MLQPMAAIPELIAGRYRVQGKLARGGMGEVLAVTDVSTGAAVALKRMLPDLAEQRSLVVQFMREYHALSELRHPRIIEVYDYGVDRGAPFFTMEMLDGQDLGALSPLPYRDACRYLRDVASSLALLHARRMLHRDLSPRNVRLTSDGRCKVLDFGAMVPFGIPPNLTGTPPCIAPEALQGGPLDQRADLYSLGALAYTALTGRHAYAASQVSALPDVWMHAPPRPGRLVRDLPEALDALITGLMSMDPGKRPRTAGEVIELLTAIAGLEPDDSPAVARSFLVSSRLVGRDRACASLRSELANTMHGRGAALAIGGRAGTGRSRMLAEAALIAQTVGLSVVRLVARAQRGAASTLVGELVAGVWQAAPRESGRAIQDRPLVAELASTPVQPAAVSGEMRAQLLTQVVAYVCSVASERPLLISVDDLERADELSAALVAALAHQTSTCRLVLIASHDDKSGESLLAQVSDLALQLSLPELDRGQTTQLVASLFDDVPHVERVSEWLYRVARGNPKLTIELAEHLLNRGVVRYSGGVWVLPADIAEAVPPSTQEALLLRLRDVSPLATLLAEILCVRRGGAVVECFLDLAGVSSAVVFRALDELVRAGVFESAGDEYAFVQQELRDALARTLPPSRSQELHERWADWLLAGGSVGEDRQLEAGWHLVHTERALAGADLLAKVGPALVGRRVSMAAAIPAIERALVLYERHGRPLRECLRLRALLVLSSYLFDYRLAPRYAEATLNALYPFTGFAAIERLSRCLGKTLGFMVGVAWTALGWCFRWGPRRGPNVLAAII